MSSHSNSAKATKSSRLKKVVVGTAVAGMIAMGSVATISAFSDQATSNVTVTAGSIALKAGGSDTFNVALPEIVKPGDTATKTITLSNTGTLPLKYTAATTSDTANTLSPVIDVIVTPSGGTAMSSMKLKSLAIPETTIAAGGTQTLTLKFTWPNGTAAVDNALMGKKGDSTITFSAVAA